MFAEIFVTAIGFFGRGESRKLPHGEKFAAISSRVNAARKRRLSRVAQMTFVVPVFGEIGLRIQTANWQAGNSGEAGTAVLVEVDAGYRADCFFRGFLERGKQNFFRPSFFGVGGMAVLGDVGDGGVGC